MVGEDGNGVGGEVGPDTSNLRSRLVLIVIALVIFHVGALVSY